MEVRYINDITNYQKQSNELIDVTIGFFDAVHIGHQALIKELEKSSKGKAIITFDQHPNKSEIMSLSDKLCLLKEFDIDQVYVIELNEENQSKSKQEFVDFLKRLNVCEIIVGKDFKFGKKAKGDLDTLRNNFIVKPIEFVELRGQKVSSSIIRELIDEGDLEGYFKQTKRNYTLCGEVIKGDQIGRTIDFPTANLKTSNQVIKHGVYITRVHLDGKSYQAITNIGSRPTVGGRKIQIESNIFDFNDIIYSKQICVEFLKLIRLEQKFGSLDELKAQIKSDKLVAKEYYGN